MYHGAFDRCPLIVYHGALALKPVAFVSPIAEGDPGFSVPRYLLEEVDSKNKLLEKER